MIADEADVTLLFDYHDDPLNHTSSIKPLVAVGPGKWRGHRPTTVPFGSGVPPKRLHGK